MATVAILAHGWIVESYSSLATGTRGCEVRVIYIFSYGSPRRLHHVYIFRIILWIPIVFSVFHNSKRTWFESCITFATDLRFWWFLHRLKAENQGFQSVQNSWKSILVAKIMDHSNSSYFVLNWCENRKFEMKTYTRKSGNTVFP